MPYRWKILETNYNMMKILGHTQTQYKLFINVVGSMITQTRVQIFPLVVVKSVS